MYLLTYQPVQRGSWVVACLPEPIARHGRERGFLDAGRCHGASEVLKQVAALPGDLVRVREAGLEVNGVLLGGTARRRFDSSGRPLQAIAPGLYVVPADRAWLVSPHHPRSWDSRYYGAVPLGGVRSTARLLSWAQLFDR